MKLRIGLIAVVALSGVLLVAPSAFAASSPAGLGTVPLSGKDMVGSKQGKFKGTYQITDIRATERGLVTVGTVRGVVKDKEGRRATVVRRNVQAVVPARPCSILFLDIQPIDLNLLGLRIQISRITINVTGQPGPGQLLGNLLCGLLGQLDQIGPGNLNDLLNRLGPGGLTSLLDVINRLGGVQGGGVQNLLNLLNLLRGQT